MLQLNLLYLHSGGSGEPQGPEARASSFTELLQLFQEHAFGHRQRSEHLLPEVSAELADSVGMLESLTLVYLLDLPALTEQDSPPPPAGIDVSGLGSRSEHGPVMLAWMLAQYLAGGGGGADLGKTRWLGERAVQLRAVAFLDRCVRNEVIACHAGLRAIVVGVCYALLSVLVSAFDAGRMGVDGDARALALAVLHQVII